MKRKKIKLPRGISKFILMLSFTIIAVGGPIGLFYGICGMFYIFAWCEL